MKKLHTGDIAHFLPAFAAKFWVNYFVKSAIFPETTRFTVELLRDDSYAAPIGAFFCPEILAFTWAFFNRFQSP